jgi:hypothetical protein
MGRSLKLPVDPARLRKQFPALQDEDIEAYVAVTRRILAQPAARAMLLRGVMDAARTAREKAAAGAQLTPDEATALRYVQAMEKMQGPTSR